MQQILSCTKYKVKAKEYFKFLPFKTINIFERSWSEGLGIHYRNIWSVAQKNTMKIDYNNIRPLDESDYKLKPEQEIAKELKRIRIKQLHLSQNDIAKLCGISRTAWGHYEKGRCLPSRERMAKIATLADKSVQEIFYDVNTEKKEDWKGKTNV